MICPACVHYRPAGQGQPIAPRCAWQPTPEHLATLRAILPAPILSRALGQTAPYHVEECAALSAREASQ